LAGTGEWWRAIVPALLFAFTLLALLARLGIGDAKERQRAQGNAAEGLGHVTA
jgi:hypothetical protein